MPSYSFGEESPLKFEISDKLATNYNAAVEQFFKAQTRFNQKFGRRWDPIKDPIVVKWTKKQLKAWNQFAGIMNDRITKEGPLYSGEIVDDYLVKNKTLERAVQLMSNTSRPVTLAVGLGVLYVLLRGL